MIARVMSFSQVVQTTPGLLEYGNQCCLDVVCAKILAGGILKIFVKTVLFIAVSL
jgi:hypothetical protein